MGFCPYCGSKTSDLSRFCGSCGREIPAQPTTFTQNRGNNTVPLKQTQNTGYITNQAALKIKNPQKGKILLFSFLQILLYFIIGVMTVAVIYLPDSVSVNTSLGDDLSEKFSLISVMNSMITGGIYNPTAASIAISVAGLVSTFGTAAFWGLTALFKLFGKGKRLHIISVVFTVINTAYICLYIPLLKRYSGLLYSFYAKQINCFAKNISSITSIWVYFFAAAVYVLLATELVLAYKEKKAAEKSKEVQ